MIWDAATGERQRPPLQEVGFQRARAARAEERAERETEARKKAEQQKQKAEQEKKGETEARKKAERLNREMLAELEQLRAQVRKPPS